MKWHGNHAPGIERRIKALTWVVGLSGLVVVLELALLIARSR